MRMFTTILTTVIVVVIALFVYDWVKPMFARA